ncbi:MAG TPA: NUDIX domain-containing protein [Longimicrobiaceae bacterium]|nr:NUDIX domain-containing protein [Longimicrobiaceae bacterium]
MPAAELADARRIRVVAGALVRAGDRLLVERGRDTARGFDFYRVIGGGVDFGESAADAVVREWSEEFGLTLSVAGLLGVLENHFTYESRPGHEIVFVFAGSVAEAWVADRDRFTSTDEKGAPHEAEWVSIAALRDGPAPLFPAGVLDLLAAM